MFASGDKVRYVGPVRQDLPPGAIYFIHENIGSFIKGTLFSMRLEGGLTDYWAYAPDLVLATDENCLRIKRASLPRLEPLVNNSSCPFDIYASKYNLDEP